MKRIPFILRTSFQAVASTVFPTTVSVKSLQKHRNFQGCQENHNKPSLQTSPQSIHIKTQYVPNLCNIHLYSTDQTSCLKLQRYMYTCDHIWPIRRSAAAFTAQMCCQREGLIKVTLMEMQLITAPCWRQGESVAGNMWRTRCSTWAESH